MPSFRYCAAIVSGCLAACLLLWSYYERSSNNSSSSGGGGSSNLFLIKTPSPRRLFYFFFSSVAPLVRWSAKPLQPPLEVPTFSLKDQHWQSEG